MSKVSTKDLLDMGAYIKDMPVEKLKESLLAMVSKHPTTALKLVFERPAINSYSVPNRYTDETGVRDIKFSLTPAQLEEIKSEWRLGTPPMGNKIGAIKIFRNITGKGLADSKCCIEWLMEKGIIN